MGSRVAIIGTVGVPARYGGFETLGQHLAQHIKPTEHLLYLYCQRSAYSASERTPDYCGHRRIFVPLRANGPSSLVYDMLSALDAIVLRRCKVLLCLGVSGTFSLPLIRLLFPWVKIVLNVDGLESRREVWGLIAKWVLGTLEWIGVRTAHVVVADNRVIRSLIHRRFGRNSATIAYGGNHVLSAPGDLDSSLPARYVLAISRIVPENNIHLILAAFAGSAIPLVYVGNWSASPLGRKLREQYAQCAHIHLLDPIYDPKSLSALRANALACVHGHSVGGTNPALVEALFWAPNIFAYDCAFNHATLDNQFYYWRTAADLGILIRRVYELDTPDAGILQSLRKRYTWETIAAQYQKLFDQR